MRVHCVTNNPAKNPSRARLRSVSIENHGFGFDLLFGNDERQTIHFPITHDYRLLLLCALKQVETVPSATIVETVLRVLDFDGFDDAERMKRIRKAVAIYKGTP